MTLSFPMLGSWLCTVDVGACVILKHREGERGFEGRSRRGISSAAPMWLIQVRFIVEEQSAGCLQVFASSATPRSWKDPAGKGQGVFPQGC